MQLLPFIHHASYRLGDGDYWIVKMLVTRADSSGHTAGLFCCLIEQPSHVACLHCDIRHLAVCGALGAKSLRELQRRVRHVRFEPAQTIVMEHELAASAFVVHSGAVSLYKEMLDGRRQIVGFLLPGDFIGFACDDGRYCHSAEAVTRSELCRLSAGYLRQLAREHPEVQDRLMGALSTELCAAQEHLLWVGRKSALERVASFLLMLARRGEHRGGRANDVRLPMSRQQTADFLGMTEASVTRSLGQLAKKSVIWIPRPHEIIIRKRTVPGAAGVG
jgi:CRP/FNR family transcriptional regulator